MSQAFAVVGFVNPYGVLYCRFLPAVDSSKQQQSLQRWMCGIESGRTGQPLS